MQVPFSGSASRSWLSFQPVDKPSRARIGLFRPGPHMAVLTMLLAKSTKPPSTNLTEQSSILASRQFIHRLLSTG